MARFPPPTRKGKREGIAMYSRGCTLRDLVDLLNGLIQQTQRQAPRGLLIAMLISLIGPRVSAQVNDVFLAVEANSNRPVIKVSNAHPSAIEAFLITVDIAHKGGRLDREYYDSHVAYRHDVPIAPGQSHEMPLPYMVGGPQPTPILRAVVFSDGTTIGEAQWVTELLRRRSIMIARLSEVLALLDRAAQQNLTKEQAITLVQQAGEVRKRAAAASGESPEEVGLEGLAFYGVSTTLAQPIRPGENPPELQNRIKSISHAYRGWLEDLESAKPPPPLATSSPDAVN